MEPWLERQQKEQDELVQPVQVVGDDDVVARARNVRAALDIEAEAQPKQGNSDHTHQAIRKVGARTDGQEVCGGQGSGRGRPAGGESKRLEATTPESGCRLPASP